MRCSVADLNGRDFIAIRRLSNKADVTLADVGETCERVPASSLPALLDGGKIRRVVAVTEEVWADLGRPDEAES
jgi:hypothetical protein